VHLFARSACAEGIGPGVSFPSWSSSSACWLETRATLTTVVDSFAHDESSGSTSSSAEPQDVVNAADLGPSTYENISPRDFAVLVKDPDVSKGRKTIVYGVVTQFDAATGTANIPCGYRS
jgi:hypothetical protein